MAASLDAAGTLAARVATAHVADLVSTMQGASPLVWLALSARACVVVRAQRC